MKADIAKNIPDEAIRETMRARTEKRNKKSPVINCK